MKTRFYIPFGGNVELLNKCVTSIVERLGKFMDIELTKPIVIINNTLKSVMHDLYYSRYVEEKIPPVELVHAQEANWTIKMSQENQEDFALTLHTDAELLDGALEDMFETTNAILGTKWVQVLAYGSGVFSAINWRFFAEENVDFDPFLFPMYFMDNHMYKIIEARGWRNHITRRAMENLVRHVSSHYLKENDIFRRKNDLAFPLHEQLYVRIWGGKVGQETSNDPTAAGTLRIPHA